MLPGGRLTNSYQGQRNTAGTVALPGLIFVGDAVCTTTPTAGRGVATSLMQAQQLLLLLEVGDDLHACSMALEGWCDANIQPWFDDHVAMDAAQVSRWSGHDIDLTKRLPSDLIVTAAEADPTSSTVPAPTSPWRPSRTAFAASNHGRAKSTKRVGGPTSLQARAATNWPPW